MFGKTSLALCCCCCPQKARLGWRFLFAVRLVREKSERERETNKFGPVGQPNGARITGVFCLSEIPSLAVSQSIFRRAAAALQT